MASPQSTTSNASGNLLASQSLAASTSVSFNLDVSAKYAAAVSVGSLPSGSVAAGAALQVQVFRRIGSGPRTDTVPLFQFQIPSVASTQAFQSFELDWGRYTIKLSNLDASNATTVESTDDTFDAQA